MKKCDNNDFCKKMIKIFRKNFIKKKKKWRGNSHESRFFFAIFNRNFFEKKKA